MKKIISAIKKFFTDAAYCILSALIYVVDLAKNILVLLASIALAIFAIRLGKKQAKNAYEYFDKQTVSRFLAAQSNASEPPQKGTPSEPSLLAHDAEGEESSIASTRRHQTLLGGRLLK